MQKTWPAYLLITICVAVAPRPANAQAANPRIREIARDSVLTTQAKPLNHATPYQNPFHLDTSPNAVSAPVFRMERNDSLLNGALIGAAIGAVVGYFALGMATGGDAYPNRTIGAGIIVGAAVRILVDSKR